MRRARSRLSRPISPVASLAMRLPPGMNGSARSAIRATSSGSPLTASRSRVPAAARCPRSVRRDAALPTVSITGWASFPTVLLTAAPASGVAMLPASSAAAWTSLLSVWPLATSSAVPPAAPDAAPPTRLAANLPRLDVAPIGSTAAPAKPSAAFWPILPAVVSGTYSPVCFSTSSEPMPVPGVRASLAACSSLSMPDALPTAAAAPFRSLPPMV